MVSTLASLVPMEAGVNASVAPRPASTVSEALVGAVLAPALVLASAPAAIVLAYVPDVPLVTLTVTVQEPEAGIVPPESATLVPLLAAVTVPPAHVVAPDALEIGRAH